MLQNAPTLAIVAVHTEENEPSKVWAQKIHYFNHLLFEGIATYPAHLPCVLALFLEAAARAAEEDVRDGALAVLAATAPALVDLDEA